MRRLLTIVALATIAACSGTSISPPDEVPGHAHEILSAATSMEIISLYPYEHDLEAQGLTDAPMFHSYAELGRATLTDTAKIQAVVAAVYQGIEDSDGTIAACFSPRHGIHAEVDGKPVDLVICYHCLSMHIYVEGERNTARTTEAPGAILTKIWGEAGLSIQQDS